MRGYRYMHVCRHRVSSGQVEEIIDSPELFSQKGKQTAVLIDGANVLEIIEVRVKKYEYDRTPPTAFDDYNRLVTYDDPDSGEGFFDRDEGYKVDYAPLFRPGAVLSEPLPPEYYRSALHNRIEFLVYPPTSFVVKMRVRYSDVREASYAPADCPKCNGRGWFIDLLDEQGRFVTAGRNEHVIQDFVKILLMRVGSSALDLTNGSRIHDIIGSTLPLDEMELHLSEVVSECVDNYLEQQAIADTSDYEPDELLRDVQVSEFAVNPSNPRGRILRLMFVTDAGANIYQLQL